MAAVAPATYQLDTNQAAAFQAREQYQDDDEGINRAVRSTDPSPDAVHEPTHGEVDEADDFTESASHSEPDDLGEVLPPTALPGVASTLSPPMFTLDRYQLSDLGRSHNGKRSLKECCANGCLEPAAPRSRVCGFHQNNPFMVGDGPRAMKVAYCTHGHHVCTLDSFEAEESGRPRWRTCQKCRSAVRTRPANPRRASTLKIHGVNGGMLLEAKHRGSIGAGVPLPVPRGAPLQFPRTAPLPVMPAGPPSNAMPMPAVADTTSWLSSCLAPGVPPMDLTRRPPPTDDAPEVLLASNTPLPWRVVTRRVPLVFAKPMTLRDPFVVLVQCKPGSWPRLLATAIVEPTQTGVALMLPLTLSVPGLGFEDSADVLVLGTDLHVGSRDIGRIRVKASPNV